MQLPNLNFKEDTVTLGNIFGISWKLYTENFQAIAIIIAIVYIPVDIIIFFFDNIPDVSLKDYIKVLGYLEEFIGIIATLALAIFLTGKIENQQITIKDSLHKALQSWGKVVLTNFITGIMIGLLTLLLIVPGIIYGTYWTFITYIVLFLGLTGEGARNHSKLLVTNRWWKTFGMVSVFFLLSFILGMTIGFVFYFFLGYFFYDFETFTVAENFVVEMLKNFTIDILASYFTICLFVLFVAYQSVYGGSIGEKNGTTKTGV